MTLDLNVGINVNTNENTNTSGHSASSSSSNPSQSSNLVDCYICKKKVDLISMRKHVGHHILSKTVSGINVCGFCGRNTCENVLKRSSTKGTTVYFKVQSNCSYHVEYRKIPTFSTRNPCSNHLIPCTVCKASIWTVYNVMHHYTERHPGLEVPILVTEQEIRKMLKKWTCQVYQILYGCFINWFHVEKANQSVLTDFMFIWL